jgi:hypothetical protein
MSNCEWTHENDATLDGMMCESFIAETMVDIPTVTIVVLRKLHALMRVSNVLEEQSATGTRHFYPIPVRHQQRRTVSHAACNNYSFTCWSSSHLFPQLCQGSPPNKLKIICMKKPKWRQTLPCARTVTSQQKFGGQHGGVHGIDGSENGASLWTRAQTITERQPQQ